MVGWSCLIRYELRRARAAEEGRVMVVRLKIRGDQLVEVEVVELIRLDLERMDLGVCREFHLRPRDVRAGRLTRARVSERESNSAAAKAVVGETIALDSFMSIEACERAHAVNRDREVRDVWWWIFVWSGRDDPLLSLEPGVRLAFLRAGHNPCRSPFLSWMYT